MKNTTKARKSKEPKKLVHETADFRVYTIPLNYMIQYKVKAPQNQRKSLKKGSGERMLIPQYQYSPLDRGLDYAIETAEYSIQKALADNLT